MKDFLNYLITKITLDPDSVQIEETEDEETINYKISVVPADAGIIIGKKGKNINSLRLLLSIYQATHNLPRKKIFLSLD